MLLDQGERVHGASTLFLYGHRWLDGRHITLYAVRGQATPAAGGALGRDYNWQLFVTRSPEARRDGARAPHP